ncbi:Eco47II family restriction endonuclease [Candidatus Thioglobus sp.]|nr:Eco47II family restriction endonuclease [Candidatus Thioglobus sp.]
MNSTSKIYFDKDKFNEYFLKHVFIPTVTNPEQNIYKNTLDPFSAKLDILVNSIKPQAWLAQEKVRQKQKTLQNKIGLLHQSIVGFFDGWDDLGKGGVIDVVNHERKIIAEIKNKFNTKTGQDRVDIYDALNNQLNQNFNNYIGYYVEILPKNQKSYNEVFTPSDNEKNNLKNKLINKYKKTANNQYLIKAESIEVNRKANENIRVIDGLSWYTLVSGDKNFIFDLYNKHIINAIKYSDEQTDHQYLSISLHDALKDNAIFDKFLNKAYFLD